VATEDADVVRLASAANIIARFTGTDWGEPHSGAQLAKSFVDGPFSQVAGRHRPTAVAVMAIELAIEDYLTSLRHMPAPPMALIARALHLSRGRIAELIADDSLGASRIREALARIDDQAVRGGGRGARGPSGGADETDDATTVWPAST
jgi:hypothetical protein